MNPMQMQTIVEKVANDAYPCAKEVMRIINDPKDDDTFNTMYVSSGKAINDLGNYEKCQSYRKNNTKILQYALISIDSVSQATLRV